MALAIGVLISDSRLAKTTPKRVPNYRRCWTTIKRRSLWSYGGRAERPVRSLRTIIPADRHVEQRYMLIPKVYPAQWIRTCAGDGGRLDGRWASSGRLIPLITALALPTPGRLGDSIDRAGPAVIHAKGKPVGEERRRPSKQRYHDDKAPAHLRSIVELLNSLYARDHDQLTRSTKCGR